MSIWKKTVLCVLAAGLLLAGGCLSITVEEDPPGGLANEQQINPLPEAEDNEVLAVTLYFGYKTEQLLAGEERNVSVPITEDADEAVLRALIAGTAGANTDFTAVINPDTKVVDLTESDGFLFVTLSKEFLQPPEDIAKKGVAEGVRRYLAVYSVTNTLIELGSYEKVQILIDRDNTGSGTPMTYMEAGLSGEDSLEPRGHSGNIILNSRNTAREILTALESKDYSRLYGFIASQTENRLSSEDFLSAMMTQNITLQDFAVVDHTGGVDKDLVFVNYTIKWGDGEPQVRENIPVTLIRENGLWKISYSMFSAVFME